MKFSRGTVSRRGRWSVSVGIAVVFLAAALLQTSVASATPTRWSVVTSPNRGSTSNILRAVSCPTASSCIAVGSYLNKAGISRTLTESWNGTKWSVVKSPNASSYGNALNGIACTSSIYCVAVGDEIESESQDIELTLIETWDGNSWSVVPSANPSSSTDDLNSVFCSGPGNCTAVGFALEGSGESEGDRALVESLGSGVWSVIDTPPVGRASVFTAVTCFAGGCIAVGNEVEGNIDEAQPLIETSTGTTWTVQTSPTGSYTGYLSGISCPSSSLCIAVGEWMNGTSAGYRPLTVSEDDSGWSIVKSPKKGDNSNLEGLSCTSTDNCVAAGYYNSTLTASDATLIESWNGSKWLVTASPNPSSAGDELLGVSCARSSKCEAVGGTEAGGTLVEAGK
jgi:hypothetical protein